MFNAIYCEFLKLKKSYFYLVLAAITCFFPILLCLGWGAQGAFVTWNKYIFQVEQMSFMFINIAMYTLISSYIYTREFSCNTANSMFSYPISRTKIFMSKFIVILLITLSITVLQILLTALGGLLLPHEELTKQILLSHLRINLYALLFQYVLLPIAIFISLLSRNVIMPMVYGGLVTVANMFAIGFKNNSISEYIPIIYPIKILFNSFKSSKVDMGKMVIVNSREILSNTSIIIAISTFVIGMLLCIIYYSKEDID